MEDDLDWLVWDLELNSANFGLGVELCWLVLELKLNSTDLGLRHELRIGLGPVDLSWVDHPRMTPLV